VLVVRQTECQSRVLQLQHEYDQIMLATSKTFQDYKDHQSYEKELSEQMWDFRSSAKKLAVEKSSIGLALEDRTQEYDELQMKVDDIIRQQKEASRSKSLLEQQKKQLFFLWNTKGRKMNTLPRRLKRLGMVHVRVERHPWKLYFQKAQCGGFREVATMETPKEAMEILFT
jgi:chromosome segregation ATPase